MANVYIEIKVDGPDTADWVNVFLRHCIGILGPTFQFAGVDGHDKAHSIFKVSGEGAHAFLRKELAELINSRPPFVSVSLLEEIGDEVFPLDPASVEVTWFRNPSAVDSSFVQHIDSCARLVHPASGTAAQCTDSRSRAKNHAEALALLRSRIFASQRLFATTSAAVVRKLTESDLPALQAFFEANPDYFVAVNGMAPRADEARQEFEDRPPAGMPFDDAFTLGLADDSGRLIAMASITANLLAPRVWHIGLFIVATSLHGSGTASSLYAGLEAWLKAQGACWIRLGAVVGNTRAERFWERQGYTEVRRRAGTQLGHSTHTVRVFVKPLGASGLDDYLNLVARDRPESLLP